MQIVYNNKFVMYFIFTMIVLDLITGIVQSCKNKDFASSKMREGLYHKIGIIFTIVLALLIDSSLNIIDLGFNLPVFNGVAVYIVLMEIGSILENIKKINPDILPENLKNLLNNGKHA